MKKSTLQRIYKAMKDFFFLLLDIRFLSICARTVGRFKTNFFFCGDKYSQCDFDRMYNVLKIKILFLISREKRCFDFLCALGNFFR